MKSKKLLLALAAGLFILSGTSCTTSRRQTATTLDVATTATSNLTADLIVSPTKISFTYKPDKQVRRGGNKAIMAAAVAEALKQNGNADVLVQPEYEYRMKKRGIKEIKVTGYPAKYANFKNVK